MIQVLGHVQTSLESTLRFCGVDIRSINRLNCVNFPNFKERDEVRGEPLWYPKWNKQIRNLSNDIITHASRFYPI